MPSVRPPQGPRSFPVRKQLMVIAKRLCPWCPENSSTLDHTWYLIIFCRLALLECNLSMAVLEMATSTRSYPKSSRLPVLMGRLGRKVSIFRTLRGAMTRTLRQVRYFLLADLYFTIVNYCAVYLRGRIEEVDTVGGVVEHFCPACGRILERHELR